MRENRTCGSEGGEAQSLPYPYRRGEASLLGVGLFAQWMAFGAFYTASETPTVPGHRASLASSAIRVYLCASVVK